MTTTEYDVVIIGAGPVGENVAGHVVQGGLTAAIIEAELVGGECSYWACMPTKALLRDASALRSARHVPGVAAALTGNLDVSAVLARRDRFASDWSDDGQVAWLDEAGITLVHGHGRISGDRTVTVTGRKGPPALSARHAVVITTGSSADRHPFHRSLLRHRTGLTDPHQGWSSRPTWRGGTPTHHHE